MARRGGQNDLLHDGLGAQLMGAVEEGVHEADDYGLHATGLEQLRGLADFLLVQRRLDLAMGR